MNQTILSRRINSTCGVKNIYHLETTDFNRWIGICSTDIYLLFKNITSCTLRCDVFEKKIDVFCGNSLTTD